MSQTQATASLNIGFLTILQETGGQLGGYLVTNVWGRPLEFRLSTAVQPNRVQQILYGRTLQSYICADLIGKTLLEKTATPVQLLITDRAEALDLRWHTAAPVLWLAPADVPDPGQHGNEVRQAQQGQGPVLCHAQFPGDAAQAQALLARLDGTLDLAEPFGRIREAVNEARKMGVTQRN